VRTVLARESEVHRLLTTERILGLDLLRGRKATSDVEVARPLREPVEIRVPAAVARGVGTKPASDTAGLPLFSADGSKRGES
jgi:hypothetical protein